MPARQPDGGTKAVDIRTLRFVRFDGNEAYNIKRWGLNRGEFGVRVGPDAADPFIIRDISIWTCGKGCTVHSPSVLIDRMTVHETVYGVWGSIYQAQDYRNVRLTRRPLLLRRSRDRNRRSDRRQHEPRFGLEMATGALKWRAPSVPTPNA